MLERHSGEFGGKPGIEGKGFSAEKQLRLRLIEASQLSERDARVEIKVWDAFGILSNERYDFLPLLLGEQLPGLFEVG